MTAEPKDKIDELLSEVLDELDKIDGQGRMIRALEASCTLTGSMIADAQDEVLYACRGMAWDAWACMLADSSPMRIKRKNDGRDKH